MKEKTTSQNTDFKTMFIQLENTLDLYFVKKAPPMPSNIKEAIVKYGPYITVVMMFMLLPLLLAAFGLSALLLPFSYMGGVRYGLGFSFNTIFSLVILVMQAFALPSLFKRQISGWKFLYYVALIQAVQSLLRFDLGSLIIGSAISLYILFQVKSYYK